MLNTGRYRKSFSLHCDNFSLAFTLECGQVFRWNKVETNEYLGVVGPYLLNIRQDGTRLTVRASDTHITPSFIESYFDLTLDLPYIYNTIGQDNHIKAALRKFRGLRIIRQPLWECLASFIISAYNNIPRIRSIIFNISQCFGGRVSSGGYKDYLFPAPQKFVSCTPNQLARCGTGYRAPYLKAAAEFFLGKRLSIQKLSRMPYIEAKNHLMQIPGVGEKVADCVLLYSVGKLEAFPIDVWIKRVMEKLYFDNRKTSVREIRQFAAGYFGAYAGYAQQYLYYHGRGKGL